MSELATLPGEDRRQRLYDALAAYDDALRFIRPDNAPLDYAQTQNNRANRLSELATLPGEDRRQRLTLALRCAHVAASWFDRLQHDQYLRVARNTLERVKAACGQDFAEFWAELELGDPPDWLNRAPSGDGGTQMPEELQQRLRAAGVTDDASLHAALEHDPELRSAFEEWLGSQNPEAMMQATMAALLNAFVQVQNAEQMIAFWQAVPGEMEEPFIEAVEALIAQAGQAGDQGTVEHLRSRLQGFREIRADAASTLAAGEPILALLQQYQDTLRAADAEKPQVAPWQTVVDLGEGLLAMQAGAEALLDWDGLRDRVASDYNTLGNAHDVAGDPAAALAAFERAVALQPDFAMWQRNRAGTLIDLGRLDEARAAIDQARALEPDAARLAQLEAQLAAAWESAGG